MLTVDVGMNVLLGDVIAVGQVVAEPGGVQNGAEPMIWLSGMPETLVNT